jgi:Fur family transcriptional regulator, peroxide stress response regulator
MQELHIKSYLTKNGVRPLRKRVKIMHYLISNRNHPTVDVIYSDLVKKIDRLSKTTVYNVLNLFVQEGLVIALNIENNELRYDADTSSHGHFKCKTCGKIFDFDLNKEDLPKPPLTGFKIDEYQYSIKGVCAFCRNKMEACATTA